MGVITSQKKWTGTGLFINAAEHRETAGAGEHREQMWDHSFWSSLDWWWMETLLCPSTVSDLLWFLFRVTKFVSWSPVMSRCPQVRPGGSGRRGADCSSCYPRRELNGQGEQGANLSFSEAPVLAFLATAGNKSLGESLKGLQLWVNRKRRSGIWLH